MGTVWTMGWLLLGCVPVPEMDVAEVDFVLHFAVLTEHAVLDEAALRDEVDILDAWFVEAAGSICVPNANPGSLSRPWRRGLLTMGSHCSGPLARSALLALALVPVSAAAVDWPVVPEVGVHLSFPLEKAPVRWGLDFGADYRPDFAGLYAGLGVQLDFGRRDGPLYTVLVEPGYSMPIRPIYPPPVSFQADVGVTFSPRDKARLAFGGHVEVGSPYMGYHRLGVLGRFERVAMVQGGIDAAAMALQIQALLEIRNDPGVDGRPFRLERRRVRPRIEVPGRSAVELDSAAEELAAVSTFLRTARELRALGAPAGLVRRCLQAACEEADHVVDQVALLGASSVRAWPLPAIPRHVVDEAHGRSVVAHENLVDGWEGERAAASRLRVRARSARDRDRRRLLRMAAEEQRHAELSRDVARWCLGGRCIVTA